MPVEYSLYAALERRRSVSANALIRTRASKVQGHNKATSVQLPILSSSSAEARAMLAYEDPLRWQAFEPRAASAPHLN